MLHFFNSTVTTQLSDLIIYLCVSISNLIYNTACVFLIFFSFLFLFKLTKNRMLRFSFTSNVLRFTLWMFIEDKYFIFSLYKYIFFYLLSMNLFSPIAPANKNNLGESWRVSRYICLIKIYQRAC